MSLKLITGPTSEPVTLAQAKSQCRVDSDVTADDDLITALIIVARQQAEHEMQRALLSQTWRRTLDFFPGVEIELGMPPVISITSIIYTDTAGVDRTLSSAAYVLDTSVEPGHVLPAETYTWPDTLDSAGPVRVTFTAGYGSAAADVPEAVRQWIKIRVADLYKFRETSVGGSLATLGYTDRLLDRYRYHGG